MTQKKLVWSVALIVVLTFTSLGSSWSLADTSVPPSPSDIEPGAYRIYYENRDQLADLATHFDIWEINREAGYAILGLDAPAAADLMARGYRLELDVEKTQEWILGPPGYPCYRDVDQLYADLVQIVSDYPSLTALLDYGDSWRKVNNVPPEYGYDLLVLRLTNQQTTMPKPRFFLMAAIHARELTTPETVMYFVDYLLSNYDTDPDATWILDHHEIYVVVVANPDGRQLVEEDCYQRKNRNDTEGSCNYCDPWGFNHYGVDLNRNNSYHWGGAGTSPCGATYQGIAAASEPETYYLNDFVRSIIPDQRADDDVTPAPDDTTGLLISLHSYSNLVLWPWGFTSTPAPNGTSLQTLGRKFAYFNNYYPEQSNDLYPTTGDTIDWAYGELGIPAYTFEVGETFFQSCNDLQQIMDENLGALLYAAKVPRTPYMTPSGPDVPDLAVSFDDVPQGTIIDLTSTIDDTRYNNSGGTEPTQNIAAAEYYIDVPPWITTTLPVSYSMAAEDGSFDAETEDVVASIDTADLDLGRHIIFVRGQDVSDNWGAFTAVFLTITVGIEPEAAFTAFPDEGCAPLTVQFTDVSTQTVTEWLWDFGDGVGTSTETNPIYTYDLPGTFTVTLTVSNVQGSDWATGTITAYAGPTAVFTWTPSTIYTDTTVQFTDTSTGTVAEWEWAFSDGAIYTSATPTHTFSSTGTFTVTLTVTNDLGCPDVAQDIVTVSEAPEPPPRYVVYLPLVIKDQ